MHHDSLVATSLQIETASMAQPKRQSLHVDVAHSKAIRHVNKLNS